MKNRIAIFAHYDKNNIIDQYVIDYLTELNKFSKKIIFISDGNVSLQEFKKIDHLCDIMISGKHGEYDFGSWKRGFSELQKQIYFQNVQEIVFVNDSCWLVGSLKKTFNEMEAKDLDFWGLAESIQGKHRHVHSYFFALRRAAFSSNQFQTFLSNTKQEKNKKDIIKNYEFGLSEIIVGAGFKMGSLFGIMDCGEISKEKTIKGLISKKFPLMKINIFQLGFVNLANFKNTLDSEIYETCKINLFRRIGDDSALLSHKIVKSYKKFFLLNTISVSIKNYCLKIKVLGIPVLKIKLNEKAKDNSLNTESDALLA